MSRSTTSALAAMERVASSVNSTWASSRATATTSCSPSPLLPIRTMARITHPTAPAPGPGSCPQQPARPPNLEIAVHAEKARAAVAVVVEARHVVALALAGLGDANRSQVRSVLFVEKQPIRAIVVGATVLNDVDVVQAIPVHRAACDLPPPVKSMRQPRMSKAAVAFLEEHL